MTLQELDTQLLLGWQALLDSGFADHFFPLLRDKYTWYPAYVLLIIVLLRKYGRLGWVYVLGAILALSISDLVNSHFIKELIGRPRPCHLPELAGQLKLLVNCSPHFSMPSSHASNHFALSAVLVFSGAFSRLSANTLLWFWATSVGMAQVYVGVHYPGDILAGAVQGILLGWMLSLAVRKMADAGKIIPQ